MAAAGPVITSVVDRVRLSYPYFTIDLLKTKDRSLECTGPRHYAWYLLRVRGYSFPWIAKHTGHWHHTTVMHGIKVHIAKTLDPESRMNKEAVEMNPKFALLQEIQEIRARLATHEKLISDLNQERQNMLYRLNDLREKAYAERPTGPADTVGET